MSDTSRWLDAVRSSHERMAALVTPLTEDQVTGPSYDTEWTIAQVASHLGSQSEIFDLFLTAGLTGTRAPGSDAFGPIWDRWNAKAPIQQVADSVAANGALVAQLDAMPEADRATFSLAIFGMDRDVAGFAALRLGEHAVHTWDIAVALDPAATVAADAVDLLIDTLPQRVGRAGKPVADADPVVVATTAPDRRYLLTLSPSVVLETVDTDTETDTDADPIRLPAEAFLRLVFGRLDPEHTPAEVADDSRLDTLRAAFPGF